MQIVRRLYLVVQRVLRFLELFLFVPLLGLTSTEEPTDEVLSQLMREAAEEARETNAEATQRYFEELRQAAANIR